MNAMLLALCCHVLGADAPGRGDIAPVFTLADQKGVGVTLFALRGKGNVLLVFPGRDFTPEATAELRWVSAQASRLAAAHTTVLAIGADSRESHARFAESLGLSFRVLCDPEHEVSTRYGLAAGGADGGVGRRALFLVDSAGRIAYLDRDHQPGGDFETSQLARELAKLEAGPRSVAFDSSDGVRIAATYYPVADPARPATVLLPGMRFDRSVWAAFAARLQAAGFPALAVDLRGQGESTRIGDREVKLLDAVQRGDQAFAAGMPLDASAAARWLAEQHAAAHGVVFIGSSLGANVAAIAAAGESSTRGALLFSPGLDYFGLQPLAALKALSDKPVAIVCGIEPARADAQQLKAASAHARLLARDHEGHGMALLEADAKLGDELLAWLAETFAP